MYKKFTYCEFTGFQTAAAFTNASQTRTYFSSASRLAKLKRDADVNLDDANKQLSLLKELNKDGRFRDGIFFFFFFEFNSCGK